MIACIINPSERFEFLILIWIHKEAILLSRLKNSSEVGTVRAPSF